MESMYFSPYVHFKLQNIQSNKSYLKWLALPHDDWQSSYFWARNVLY